MERIQSSDGTSIAFDRSGEGPPVIFVPGLFQHRAIDPGTAELAALLAPRFTVFHYDRRGRGDSGDTRALRGRARGRGHRRPDRRRRVARPRCTACPPAERWRSRRPRAASRSRSWRSTSPRSRTTTAPSSRPQELAAGVAELVEAGRPGDAVALFMTSSGMPAEAVAQMRQAPFWAGLESVAHTMPYDMTLMGDTDAAERAGAHDRGPDAGARRRCEPAVGAHFGRRGRRRRPRRGAADPGGPDARGRRRAARPRAGRVLRAGPSPRPRAPRRSPRSASRARRRTRRPRSPRGSGGCASRAAARRPCRRGRARRSARGGRPSATSSAPESM